MAKQVDKHAKLAELNKRIFNAGHRHDEGEWKRYTKQAVALADELGLTYKITGYGLKLLPFDNP